MTTSSPEPPGYREPPAYLEEAAGELRKARNSNENRARLADAMHSGQAEAKQALLAEVNARRMELGLAFLAAAAIERGLPPCCHGLRAEQEPS